MSQQQKQQHFEGNDDKGEDIRSIEGSEWSVEEENIVGHGNAKQKEDKSNLKIALLEANNKILEGKLENLEGKLENLELKAQIRAMREEINLNKLKEENKAIWEQQMKAAEVKAQMAKNELEATIQEMQKKMEESLKGMAIQNEQQLIGQKQELANLKEMLKSQGISTDLMNMSWTDLIKGKKVGNPQGNRWAKAGFTENQISANGLNATIDNEYRKWGTLFAEYKFCLSVEHCREDNFSGIIIYYFEVTKMSSKPSGKICVGLSNGEITDLSSVRHSPNCYFLLDGGNCCFLSGRIHDFKWPTGANNNKPKWNGQGDVIGCGILMSPANKVSIFFTLNGILMGKKIAIGHPGDCLFPTIRICDVSVEANFGDYTAKPFRYDIKKFPLLNIE